MAENAEPRETGSSPRTRGAPRRSPSRAARARIIPAYAGSTCSRMRANRATGDHPRVRGEHNEECRVAVVARGSSPRTRGALYSGPCAVRVARIIPAYAGSTVFCHSQMLHICGSSPRTRGAPRYIFLIWSIGGIIPAYAGSTNIEVRPPCLLGDHPRVRGEHCPVRCIRGSRSGSSPRTRGAPYLMRLRMYFCGIIPAYAGSTSKRYIQGCVLGDHPRVRGEHATTPRGLRAFRGSSPRTRGALALDGQRLRYHGIIPAYAGST